MTKLICKTCQKPKANFHCGLCTEAICKSCAHFVGEETFSFLKIIPKALTHETYCSTCFDENVSETFNDYNDTMEKAKDIIIYGKEQTKLTRGLPRTEEPYRVENCEDEEEVLMRMSFFAVKAGFNAIIDVQYTTRQQILGSHKKKMWAGTGMPVTIDPKAIRGHMDPP